MEIKFKGTCVLELEHTKGMTTSKHIATDFNLDVSKNLDASKYLDENGLPTLEGVKTLTNVFVQGLIGNIHYGHNEKNYDSAEHLRYIIAELERGFIEVASSHESTFRM